MDYRTWEKAFRADARADKYRVLSDVLKRLGLPDKPRLMLHGTVDMVRACCAYNRIDNNGFFETFLRLQTYAPDTVADNLYMFTFDVFGKAYARIIVNEKCQGLDLADMFDFPWQRHKMAGFRCFWISSASWRALKKREINRLAQAVKEDLYYDFSEDELEVWFDVVRDGTCILVNLLEKEPLCDEDDFY